MLAHHGGGAGEYSRRSPDDISQAYVLFSLRNIFLVDTYRINPNDPRPILESEVLHSDPQGSCDFEWLPVKQNRLGDRGIAPYVG